MTNLSLPNYWIILLLGSYDPDTEKLLRQLKSRLSDHFMNIPDGVLVFLLDNLEVFGAEVTTAEGQLKKFTIFGEFFEDGKRLGIYILSEDAIQIVDDVDLNSSVEESIKLIAIKLVTLKCIL